MIGETDEGMLVMKSVKSQLVAVALCAGSLATGGSLSLLGSAPAAATTMVKSCVSAHIKVTHGAPQGTAGTTYIPIVFTNTGAKCSISGVPAIQPVAGAKHHAIGPAARNASMGQMPVLHVMGHGRSVSVGFGVVDTGNYPASTCVAKHADGVIVSLGTSVHPTYLHLPITVCTKRASTSTKLIVAGVNGY
jgi:hypothetical protein